MDLKGRVAIVTGASSGIGAAVARNLSEGGMRLLLTARRRDRLKTLASQLQEASFVEADLEHPDTPKILIEQASQCFGGCDVVINNAGLIATGSVQEIDLERVSQMVRINVEAAFRMIYVALRHFQSRGSGHLVNISSVLGTKTRTSAGAYSGTKHAIEALSEALRVELAGTRVQVSCVQPGLVSTELHNHMEAHPSAAMGVSEPLQPEDVARSVRYILEQPDRVRIPRLMVLPWENKL